MCVKFTGDFNNKNSILDARNGTLSGIGIPRDYYDNISTHSRSLTVLPISSNPITARSQRCVETIASSSNRSDDKSGSCTLMTPPPPSSRCNLRKVHPAEEGTPSSEWREHNMHSKSSRRYRGREKPKSPAGEKLLKKECEKVTFNLTKGFTAY